MAAPAAGDSDMAVVNDGLFSDVELLDEEFPASDEEAGNFCAAVSDDCPARDAEEAKLREAAAFLEVSHKLRDEAKILRQRHADVLSPGAPKQALLSQFFHGGAKDPLNSGIASLTDRTNRRGPKNPCYQTADERDRELKKIEIRKQAQQLLDQATQKDAEAKKADELGERRLSMIACAAAVLDGSAPPVQTAPPSSGADDGLSPIKQLPPVPAKRGRGRPRLTDDEKAARAEKKTKLKAQKGKLLPEDRDRLQTPGANARKDIVERVDQLAAKEDSLTTDEFWQVAEEKCGLPRRMLQRFVKCEEREKLRAFLDAHQPQRERRGRQRFWKRFESTDTGCRIAKDGGKKKTFTSPYADIYEYVKSWADRQQELGFELNQDDLVDEMQLEIECRVFELEGKKSDALGHLPPDDQARLSLYQGRLDNLAKPDNRKYARARIGQWCGLVERRPNNVVPFTPAENDLICRLSYQAWDFLVHLIGTGTADDLKGYVADAAGFVEHRKDVAIIAQDASPVYLDCSTGKILFKTSFLDERQRRRRERIAAAKDTSTKGGGGNSRRGRPRARRSRGHQLARRFPRPATQDPAAILPDVQSVERPSDAVGNSRREKNRLTYFFRQAWEGENSTDPALVALLLPPPSSSGVEEGWGEEEGQESSICTVFPLPRRWRASGTPTSPCPWVRF